MTFVIDPNGVRICLIEHADGKPKLLQNDRVSKYGHADLPLYFFHRHPSFPQPALIIAAHAAKQLPDDTGESGSKYNGEDKSYRPEDERSSGEVLLIQIGRAAEAPHEQQNDVQDRNTHQNKHPYVLPDAQRIATPSPGIGRGLLRCIRLLIRRRCLRWGRVGWGWTGRA